MTERTPLHRAAEAAFATPFGAVLEIRPDDAPAFYIDGRRAPCAVLTTRPDAEPACLWRANSETLARIFEGGRALDSGYLSGRLKIAGDMSVMARLKLESVR